MLIDAVMTALLGVWIKLHEISPHVRLGLALSPFYRKEGCVSELSLAPGHIAGRWQT